MQVSRASLIRLLRSSAEFRDLPVAALADLADSLELREVMGGTQVIREGEPSDSLFILVSGRLRVSRQGKDGALLLYNEIRPGECVGETGLILRQPRTADITAVRDSVLAVLDRPRYETLMMRQPLAMSQAFGQAIYNQLRHADRVHGQTRARNFAVLPLHAGAPVEDFAAQLTQALARHCKAHHVRREIGTEHLDQLEGTQDALVLEAEPGFTDWTRAALRQADQVVLVARSDQPVEVTEIEAAYGREPGAAWVRKHLAVVYPDASSRAQDAALWRQGRDVERVYPVRLGVAGDFARLARFLLGRAVGVVLGGGGARGFAHIGVMRALEEAEIPIDLLGGNSMGALIGAMVAFGVPREEIHTQILKFTRGAVRPSVPVVSILSNVPYMNALRHAFGDTTVESLWLPYFASACNLSQARTVVLDHGPLWRAVLASNSPAGLLPPVLHDGDLLVDGAILENVPVSAMRTRLGPALERRRGHGTVIAIDVDVRENLCAPNGLCEMRAGDVLKSKLSRSMQSLPGIVDILMQAGHIGGLAQRGRTVSLADYYLEPPVNQFPMMGYKSAEEIIEVGYRYACEQIASWDSLA